MDREWQPVQAWTESLYPYHHKGKLIIIENVPAGVCRHCGERYYDAGTVEKMEAIVQLKKAAKKTAVVPIRDFAEAAA